MMQGILRYEFSKSIVKSHSNWFVYIVECADGTLYTGCTTDVERRVTEHNTSRRGAHYTISRRPVILKYSEACASRSEATKREYQIKQMTRQEKTALCAV